jgi:fatty-acyl-CoA synthase
VEVKIVDGEIFIKSTARCKGYYNNPEATEDLFQDGYILSGDLGYLDGDGCLYVIGRKKNIIKHLGRTIAAQELEETVDRVQGVRYSAAIGVDAGRLEGEQVTLCAEIRPAAPVSSEEIALQIVEAVHSRLGFRPARVFLLKPHSIPLTYNGKIQHVLLREQVLSGKLKKDGLILYPES